MLKIWKSSLLDQNKYIITTRGPVRANNQLFSNPGIENENMWMLEVILIKCKFYHVRIFKLQYGF